MPRFKCFFGRVLKNESTKTLQVRRSYQLERTLGAPDDALPAQVQAEYIVGAVPNEMVVNYETAEIVNVDLGYIGTDNSQIDGPTALKAGTRPTLVDADAFNTSSDVKEFKLAVYSTTSETPTPVFTYSEELTMTVTNNLTPNKAISVLGAFDITAGQFQVDLELVAFFGNISAVQAVRNNSDVTMHMLMAKANAGIAWDVPLVALGNGQLNVEQDEPIKVPLSSAAARGRKIDANMDHTLLWVFFDYLPTVATA